MKIEPSLFLRSPGAKQESRITGMVMIYDKENIFLNYFPITVVCLLT